MITSPIRIFKMALVTSTAMALTSATSLGAFAQNQQLLTPQKTAIPHSADQKEDTSADNQNFESTTSNVNRPNNPNISATPGDTKPADHHPSQQEANESDTIVVTGSHIRGTIAAGANIEVFSREELDRSGYATVQDFIQTLPQNFAGGGGTEEPTSGQLSQSNLAFGSSVNLRGLGSDSTLALVNGRRSAQSGFHGNFNDISMLPQTAIERIEILTDGASALYGSDAIGGVVNFVLRKDFEGAETRLRYGRPTNYDADELRLAQLLGKTWGTGHALLSYEFYRRDPVNYGDRPFLKTRDYRPRGGTDRRLFAGNPGNILDPLTFQPAYAIPQNQDGRSLDVSDLVAGQINYQDRNLGATILPRQKRHSIFITAEQELSADLTVFAEARFSKRNFLSSFEAFTTTAFVPAENPFSVDPFGGPGTWVSINLTPEMGLSHFRGHVRSLAAAAGTKLDLGAWHWQTTGNYGEEKLHNSYQILDFPALNQALADRNPTTSLNVFGHGLVNNPDTLARLRRTSRQNAKTHLKNVNTIFDGPLFSIDDRAVSIAIGGDYRKETLRSETVSGNTIPVKEHLSRRVYAGFAELFIPVVTEETALPFLHKLEISSAGRLDHYNDVGTTVNPKIGISASPSKSIILTASYGTSYRAPNLTELTKSQNTIAIYSDLDPRSPTGMSQMILLSGNNPNTRSEKAKTWTFGAAIEPLFAPGLSLKATYFRTHFKDRISQPNYIHEMIAQEHLYPGLIIRNPSADQLLILCHDPLFVSEISQCTPDFIDLIVDYRVQNLAVTKIRGIDLSAAYSWEIGQVRLATGASATYMIDRINQITSHSPSVETVDTIENPVDLRARSYLTGSYNGLSGSLFVHYTDGYRNNISATQKRVDSHFSFDATFVVHLDRQLRFDGNGPFALTLSVTNLFNSHPPFADTELGYDATNADPQGRTVALDLKISW